MNVEEMRLAADRAARATQARDKARSVNLDAQTPETRQALSDAEAARKLARSEYEAACAELGLTP